MFRSEACDLRIREASDSPHLLSCEERRWHSEIAVCSELSSVAERWCPVAVLSNVCQILFSGLFRRSMVIVWGCSR